MYSVCTQCAQCVHSIYSICTHYVLSIYTISYVLSVCPHCVCSMFSLCTQVCKQYVLCVHSMYSVCIQCVHSIYSVCTQYVLSVSSVCAQHVLGAYSLWPLVKTQFQLFRQRFDARSVGSELAIEQCEGVVCHVGDILWVRWTLHHKTSITRRHHIIKFQSQVDIAP